MKKRKKKSNALTDYDNLPEKINEYILGEILHTKDKIIITYKKVN